MFEARSVVRNAAAKLPHSTCGFASIDMEAGENWATFFAALFSAEAIGAVRPRVRLVLERVDDRDVRLDLDGLAVENGGAVTPLAHGVGG